LATSIQQKQELVHQSESVFIRAWRRLMSFDCNCVCSLRDGVKWAWKRTEPGQRPGSSTQLTQLEPHKGAQRAMKIKIKIKNKKRFFTNGNDDIGNDHTDNYLKVYP
jgi:hypothetical protein